MPYSKPSSGPVMTHTIIEADEFYVCAGICRIDPETSTCVGCGRPVGELAAQADAVGLDKAQQQQAGVDADNKAS